ncbi:MAG: hypothetical protein V4662_26175 [Verrucomicrobiota bacterium]
MKSLLLTLSLVTTIALQAGDEKKAVTYEGKITGVVCVSCKEHVAGALKQKLPGVVSVDVKPGEDPAAEEKKLIIVADSQEITKDTAMAALGTYAKNYTIVSLEKKQ